MITSHPEPLQLSATSESHFIRSEPKLSKAHVSMDGKTIFLPALMRWASTREGNLRAYTVMTAHEAGHLEFGTYQVSKAQFQELSCTVRARYRSEAQSQMSEDVQTLGDIFALYPQKGVIRDLWEIVEDARVEFLLQHEYPGLRDDLAYLTKEAVQTRSLLHGMTAREMVLDSLLLFFAGDMSGKHIPPDIQEVVGRVWSLANTILRPDATAEQAILLADRLYQLLDELIGSLVGADQREMEEEEADMPSDVSSGPRAAEEVSGEYRPITNWSYRGAMDPELVQDQSSSEKDDTSKSQSQEFGESGSRGSSNTQRQVKDRQQLPTPNDKNDVIDLEQDPSLSPMEEWFREERSLRKQQYLDPLNQRQTLYDEWDGTIRDYRPKWCRVVERIGQEGTHDFMDQTLVAHAPALRLLRRYFEALRPAMLRRIGCQDMGDDIDFDAVVGRAIDRRAGGNPQIESMFAMRNVTVRLPRPFSLISAAPPRGKLDRVSGESLMSKKKA